MGEKVAYGIAVAATVGEFVVEVIDGDDERLQALGLPVLGEAAGGVEQVAMGNDQVFGAPGATAPARGQVDLAARRALGQAVGDDIARIHCGVIFEGSGKPGIGAVYRHIGKANAIGQIQ